MTASIVAAAHKNGPPVDIIELAEKLGMEVVPSYDLDDRISGHLEVFRQPEKLNDRYVITVNATQAWVRQRFTIAHEIGHFLLHSDLLGDGVEDNRAYRKVTDPTEDKFKNSKINDAHETEANQMAAKLLMPEDMIRKYWVELGRDIDQMVKLFVVSKRSMEIRLSNLGLRPM